MPTPEMRRLRELLDEAGYHWEGEDSEDVDEWGFVTHTELTMCGDVIASYEWTRDQDERTRFSAVGAKFGYLDVDGRACTAEEVMELIE